MNHGSAGQRVGIYTRVSTTAQSKEDRYSLPEQEAECRSHAEREGWAVVPHHVTHEVVSGFKPVRERPGLDALLAAMAGGEIDVLLLHDPDRLSRSQVVLGTILDRLERAGGRLAFVTGDFENDATGRFVLQARTFAAELQRERILEGSLRGKRGKAKAGKPLGAALPPFGLAYADGKTHYLPHPTNADHLRRMFSQADAGVTSRQIALGLAARGVLPPYHGRPDKRSPTGRVESTVWAPSTVDRILTNPNYIGVGWYGRIAQEERPGRRDTTKHRMIRGQRVRPLDDPNVIRLPDGVYPVLIDPALFERVQARVRANAGESQRNDRNPRIGVFRRGYSVCGGCGHNLVVRPSRSGFYYGCNSSGRWPCPSPGAIMVEHLDSQAWPVVEAVLRRPALLAERLRRHQAEDTAGPELEALDRMIASITMQQGKLARAVATLGDDEAATPLLAELKALAKQKQAAETDRAKVETQRSAWQEGENYLAQALAYTERVAEETQALGWDERRTALHRLGAKLVLWPEGYTNRWAVTLRWDNPQAADGRWEGTLRFASGFEFDWTGDDPIPDVVLNSVPSDNVLHPF